MGSMIDMQTRYNELSTQPSLLDIVRPKKRKQKISKAREYVWSVGLLNMIIKLKVEFASAGFKIVSEDQKIEDYYKKIYRENKIKKFVRNAAFEHEVVGEWYPYYTWGKNDDLSSVTLLNPELVEVKSIFGQNLIYLSASNDINYIISNNRDSEMKRLRKAIPEKFIRQWKKGKPVLLDEDKSKRYENLKAYHETYAHSPVEPIFSDLEIYRTLQEADFATAKKLKQLLLQIKVGDKDFNDGEPVGKNLLNKAKEIWNNPTKSMEIFTQWFLDAEYIIPDMDIFSNEKYESVLQRIVDWSGVSVMIEDGGSFSQGYIKVKGLKQSVQNTRDAIKESLNDLNLEIAERKGFTYYGKPKVPKIQFNNNALKDDEEIRKVVEFLYKYGMLSAEDTLDTFDFDFKNQMSKKSKENEDYEDVIKINFEPSQGLLGEDQEEAPNSKKTKK